MSKKTKEPVTFKFFGSPGGKRFCKAEQDELVRVFAACNMMLDLLESNHFSARLEKIPKGRQRLASAFTYLKNVTEELMSTAPEEQVAHLARQYNALKVLTYIGPNRSPVDKYRDQGRWMSFEELNVVALACRQACSCCMITDKQQQRSCCVNKLLNNLPVDKPDGDGCNWMEVLGSI